MKIAQIQGTSHTKPFGTKDNGGSFNFSMGCSPIPTPFHGKIFWQSLPNPKCLITKPHQKSYSRHTPMGFYCPHNLHIVKLASQETSILYMLLVLLYTQLLHIALIYFVLDYSFSSLLSNFNSDTYLQYLYFITLPILDLYSNKVF